MHTPPEFPRGIEPPDFRSGGPSAEKKSNPWVFGILGLVVGIVIGLTVGFTSNGSIADASDVSSSGEIWPAIAACQATDKKGITVMDGGNSLELQTAGKKTWEGAPFSDVTCILDELKAPESIKARMDTTRALDGRQQGSWPGFTVSWGYHPDNGLNVIVESQEQP